MKATIPQPRADSVYQPPQPGDAAYNIEKSPAPARPPINRKTETIPAVGGGYFGPGGRFGRTLHRMRTSK